MRLSGLLIASLVAVPLAVALFARPAIAQYQAPSEKLIMTGRTATTWSDGQTDIVQLDGPVTIELDKATLTAKQAVLWITQAAAGVEGKPATRQVQVALVGDAKVEQPGATRSGERMMVTAEVAGRIRLRADERFDRSAADTPLFRMAQSMRAPPAVVATAPATVPAPVPVPPVAPTQPTEPAIPPSRPPVPVPPPVRRPGTTGPTTGPAVAAGPPAVGPEAPVVFQAPELEVVDTPEGTVAVVLGRGVTLVQRRPNGDLIELQADRVVLFTPLKSLRDLQKSEQVKRIQDAVTGAYLEGDVRILFTPSDKPGKPSMEQRLQANRVYYEFTTDRAILTDAVVHTIEPQTNIPVILRAKTVRQLGQGEYNAEKVRLSTSAFAVPSYAIGADKIYVRQDAPQEGETTRMTFEAEAATVRAFGLPVFYLPSLGGSISDKQSVLRSIGFEHTQAFGFGVLTEFGLFETFGHPPPRDLDVTYRLDYYTDRGPAGGVNARYKGGVISETSREPVSFEGSFQSYFVYDHGFDDVGRPVPPEEEDRFRGHAQFEHQHFFPDGWSAQLRAGYVSDQEFLEQWFPRTFDQRLPHDVSAYVKRQKDTEAFTLLLQFQPNDLVTTSDLLQEQFEVEHVPEIGYHRIGDSVLGDRATFFSDNSLSGLHFQRTRESLTEQGFTVDRMPGIASLGTTGLTDDTVYRGDFRQEIDFPFSAGAFKIVPYVVGRLTSYSDSPSDGTKNRLFGAVGARVSTALWKTDDTVRSELFDLHRLRHVIEPELNVFTSAQTADRSDIFIYDEQIDPINDVSAAQIGLRQRWQTYRGGPGRWRSVDFLSLNVEALFFSNQPTREQLRPAGFRGLFFPSLPESSIPRDSINADMTWRISDNMVVIADASENIDGRARLATASIGLVARRDERMTYFLGTRYIADLDSNITTAAIDYQLTRKYSILLAQSFDFSQSENVASEIGITRRFDTFLVVFKAYHNETTDQSGIGFNIIPYGLGTGLDSNVLESTVIERR